MLTQPIASQLYRKICAAPKPWFKSKEGKRLIAKAIKLVEKEEGKKEAQTLKNLIVVAEAAASV